MVITQNDPEKVQRDTSGMTESEILYKNLAEQSFVGVFIVQDGKFQYANQRMAEIFGYDPADFIGNVGPEDVIHPEDWPAIKERSKKRLTGEIEKDYYCFRAIKKDRSVIYLEVYGSAVAFNKKRAVTGVVNDITAKVIAEEALQRELKRKNDFVNIAAHELRTPLQPLDLYLNMMLMDPEIYGLNEEGQKTITQLKWSFDHEVEIVNRLLDLSTMELEKERVTPVLRDFSPKHLVELILKNQRARSHAEISVTIPDDVVITSDIDYLFGILSELCSNAVLYSNPLRIISIGYEEEGDLIRIFVQDNGIGIDSEDQKNIFSPFYIADSLKMARKYGRMGLGLTLAKERAELLGGRIDVRSELGKGSTFTVSLPKNRHKAGTS
jgi:PAS domain S-box-containing protein